MTETQCEWMNGNRQCGREVEYIADATDNSFPPLRICKTHRERIREGEEIVVRRADESTFD